MTRSARLVGLDVARCLALVGMVVTHVAATRTIEGELSFGHWLAGGRASALFALLAGVGLSLATGGQTPVRGREQAARSAGIVVRAVLIGLVGLLLGDLGGSGLAIILAAYAATFVLVLPVLAWRAGPLLGLGAVWVVLGPVLLTLIRPGLAPRGVENPSLAMLGADPGRVVTEVLFTGYYPAFVWVAYLLVGMGIGRLDLRRVRVPLGLVIGGTALAVAAAVASHVLVRRPAVAAALLGDQPDFGGFGRVDRLDGAGGLLDSVATGMYGSTPVGGPGAWAWLLVDAPHSSTPFDLAQTIGSALLVVGLCLLATRRLPEAGRRFVAVLFGAGGMTLSLYTLHVWLHTAPVWPSDEPDGLAAHVLVLLVIGAVFGALRIRGPLEFAVRRCSNAVAAATRR